MPFPVPVSTTSDYSTVTGTSQTMAPTMAVLASGQGEIWIFASTVNCFVKQGSAPTATVGDGSVFVPAAQSIPIDATMGAKLAVIKATGAADGECTLVKARMLA